jgi:hypothetical protein
VIDIVRLSCESCSNAGASALPAVSLASAARYGDQCAGKRNANGAIVPLPCFSTASAVHAPSPTTWNCRQLDVFHVRMLRDRHRARRRRERRATIRGAHLDHRRERAELPLADVRDVDLARRTNTS